jgi:hypothetical protein
MITKLGTAQIQKARDDGSVKFRLTERKVDRYGEVVLPDGVVLDHYRNNPIVLVQHGFHPGRGQLPVGKLDMDSVKITKRAFDADVIFDESGADPFAMMVAQKVRDGFLNSGSIGFNAIDVSKEPVAKGQTGPTFTKWELMEFSIVSIPALPSALAKREFMEIREAIKENFGEDHITDFDGFVNRYFNLEQKDFEIPQVKDDPNLADMLNNIQEINGRVKQLEIAIKQDIEEPDPNNVTVEISETTLREIEETMTRIQETAEQTVASSDSDPN